MTREQWQRIDEVFARAIELDPVMRAAFVIAVCESDQELRAQVLSLLACDEGARQRMHEIVGVPEVGFEGCGDVGANMAGRAVDERVRLGEDTK